VNRAARSLYSFFHRYKSKAMMMMVMMLNGTRLVGHEDDYHVLSFVISRDLSGDSRGIAVSRPIASLLFPNLYFKTYITI